MELFNLTNLFFKDDEDKITTNPAKFRQEYMTDRNILSDKGISKIANALAGSISYLNRERDPTQFAQPIMINIPAIMTHVSGENQSQDKELRDMVFLNKKVESADENVKELIKEIKAKTKQLKRELTALHSSQKQTKKLGKEYCKNTHPGRKEKTKRDDCLKKLDVDIKTLEREIIRVIAELNALAQEVVRLENTRDDAKKIGKEIQERVRTIKRSLLQEYILFKKCGHLGYLAGKSPRTR
jgi:DnaJ-domain-containing protein 1